MKKAITTIIWLGLDVHKKTISACWVKGDSQEYEEAVLPSTDSAVRKLGRRLMKEGEVRACYEAGPCGYEVKRVLEGMGVRCDVIAPSLIPSRAGDRVKTDRRDARKLTRLNRAGELTAIGVPTPEQEAVRDLVRCREDVVQDGTRSWHRLVKFLLRHGRVWHQTKSGTKKHWEWLRKQEFEDPHEERVYREYMAQVDFQRGRLAGIEMEVNALAQQEPWKPWVERLRCMRGIGVVTAMTLLVELFDFRRFRPQKLAAFVGLVPTIHASGEKEHRGSITHAGNAHVRTVLVEAAWHSRHKPQLLSAIRRRAPGQPEEVYALVMKAQERLHRKFHRLLRRGKLPTVAVVAVARELACFLWALMTLDQNQPDRTPAKRTFRLTGRMARTAA